MLERRLRQAKKGMKYLLTTIGFAFLFAAPIFAAENALLARITVYWPGEGQVRACSNGARLRPGHCAVDPKQIPFGSRVLLPDGACMPAVYAPRPVARSTAPPARATPLPRSTPVTHH